MFIFVSIVVILLLLALVAWIIRRAGRSNASGRREDGAHSPTDSYIIGGMTTADTFSASGGTSDLSLASESSGETGSDFSGGSDFGGGGSGGDYGDSGGSDSGGSDGGGGGDGGGE